MPLWDKATLKLSSGQQLTILAEPNAPQQLFVNKLTFNDNKVKDTFIKHETLMKGGNLKFDLGIVPNPQNYTNEQLPYSLTEN